jgi:hypothetical protein
MDVDAETTLEHAPRVPTAPDGAVKILESAGASPPDPSRRQPRELEP